MGFTHYVSELQDKMNFDCCIANYYNMTKFFEKIHFPLTGITTHDYFSYKNLLIGEKKTWMATTPDEEAKGLQRSKNIFALNSEEAIFFSKLAPKVKFIMCIALLTISKHLLLGITLFFTCRVEEL